MLTLLTSSFFTAPKRPQSSSATTMDSLPNNMPGPSTLNLVPNKGKDDDININLCIICQNNEKNTTVTTGETGREKMIEASKIRQDEVTERLNKLLSVDESAVFYYHMSKGAMHCI